MTVITYGTFDLLHYGHMNLLKRCAALGDKLIVGVSTDEMCNEKGKQCYYSLEKRMEMVADLRYVDSVIPETSMEQKVEDCIKYDVDIFVLGSDYREVFPTMKEYHKIKEKCKIVFLERTPNISSTILKKGIKTEE